MTDIDRIRSRPLKIWLPAVRAGSDTDVYTERLAIGLEHAGHEAIIQWFPHRYDLMPWRLKYVSAPPGVDFIHANSFQGFAFKRCNIPLVEAVRAFASGFMWSRFAGRVRAVLGESPAPANAKPRHGHAVLDLKSRDAKARKIEALLSLAPHKRPIRLLEVGTGAGGIAHYFGTHPTLRCEVEAVDIADTRQTRDGYRFTLIDGVELPFPDQYFDVVVSNHVIEHVGGECAQRRHLDELRRVLKADGLGYLAVPNRWQWVEPHYRLAGLSWLPERWRSPYLRWRRRGDAYDCRPLTAARTEALLREAGFTFEQQHGRALRVTYELEKPDAPAYRLLFRHVPETFYTALRRIFPTLIYLLYPAENR